MFDKPTLIPAKNFGLTVRRFSTRDDHLYQKINYILEWGSKGCYLPIDIFKLYLTGRTVGVIKNPSLWTLE